jgi:hypothetical protein
LSRLGQRTVSLRKAAALRKVNAPTDNILAYAHPGSFPNANPRDRNGPIARKPPTAQTHGRPTLLVNMLQFASMTARGRHASPRQPQTKTAHVGENNCSDATLRGLKADCPKVYAAVGSRGFAKWEIASYPPQKICGTDDIGWALFAFSSWHDSPCRVNCERSGLCRKSAKEPSRLRRAILRGRNQKKPAMKPASLDHHPIPKQQGSACVLNHASTPKW